VNKLYNKYQKLFKNVNPRIEKPILTTVFAQKLHYKKAFSLIKNLNDYKFDLFGSFKLLNISKLSKLYEVYNLYIILDSIKQKLRLDMFKVSALSNRNDEIIEKIAFENNEYSIKLWYELKYYGTSRKEQEIEVRRIDTREGGHYNPDFVLEIVNKIELKKKYYILDAKYSKFQTVKNNYLPDLIGKYILNTGINGYVSMKVTSLSLIIPNEYGQKIIESDYFEPTIAIIASKPNFEDELRYFIKNLLEKDLSENLILK